MILLIDNYDSFTYNIVEYLQILHQDVVVFANDDDRVFELDFDQISHIILSPGPGIPEQSGNTMVILDKFQGKIPMLGVCLGFQCINFLYGGKLLKGQPVHGIVEPIQHLETGLFKDLNNPLQVTRYHSLYLDPNYVSPELTVTSSLASGLIMSIEHREKQLYGVQFHPEAILTEQGLKLLENFLRIGYDKNN